MNCKVNGCRFKQYHTTIGHKCGLCHKYGHGQIECNNTQRIQWLSQFYNDKLYKKDYCTFTKCKHKWSHTTKSHHCHKCFKNHHSDDCLIKSYNNLIQHYDFLKDYDHIGFFSDNSNCFINHTIGMGCTLFLRCKNGKIEGEDFWWMMKADEGHGFRLEENKMELYSELDDFFGRYLN